ncbi:MAG: hypothetical protein KC620_15840, partial [Myxococcales bacterium]|nr:hypothetical protein [Myxococcales bacterium]
MPALRRSPVPRALASLLPVALLLVGLLPATPARAYERTWYHLTTGNGHGFQIFDRRAGRLTAFLEHPYRYVAPPDERRDGGVGRRNLAHDIYFGVRVDGSTAWLTQLDTVEYEAQTNILHAVTRHQGVRFDVRYFAPFGYEGNALVMTIEATNEGGAEKAVSLYAKPNMKLGRGRVDPDDLGERIDWLGTHGVETGPGGGHVLYVPIGGVDAAGCGSDAALFEQVRTTGEVGAADRCQGDAQVLVTRADRALPGGASAWWGQAILFVNDDPTVPQAADFRDERSVDDILAAWQAFAGDGDAEAVTEGALAEFEAWRTPTAPQGLDDLERKLWRQSETILRMGQVREPTQANRRNRGMFLASLPIGEWHTGWVRDGTYAIVAQALNGHWAEARLGVEFFLNAWAGFFSQPQYLGRPYRISTVRYYGNGKEEGDFNHAGPNIETDGFGLVLWAAMAYLNESCDLDWLDTRTEQGDTVFEALTQIAEDIEALTVNNLPVAECSIWEVHWDFRQIFTYTVASQIRGLYDFAAIARANGRTDLAERFGDRAEAMHQAALRVLVHPREDSFVSHRGVSNGDAFVDGSTVEMLSWGMVAPDDPIYRGTMQTYARLQTPFGGYRRLEPRLSLTGDAQANEYDLSEWILLDLRIGDAWRHMGNAQAADQQLDKVTGSAAVNDFLVPELFDPVRGDYAGVVPMVGYGAGAWQMAQLARFGKRMPD